ncbi:MAG: MFS transporter [Desulfobacteraceae bacterium]|nr:MFS transporter [Desulfobacteraceae bacterium]
MRSHQRSDAVTIKSQYFIYFGVMGIFLPYFNLYCYHLGFSGIEIGTLSGVRSVVLIIFPLVWSSLADHFQARRFIYILCNLISAAIWSVFLLTTAFGPMLILTVLYGIFYAPIISFLETFTMDTLGKKKTGYGMMRVWGSVAFIIVVILLGRIIDRFSINLIVTLILLGSGIQALIALNIPTRTAINNQPFIFGARHFFKPKTIVFLFCAFIMLLSHGAYYGFFSIHLEILGYDRTFIGTCWALASIAEIVVMVNSKRIFDRFSPPAILVFAFAAAVIRWIALSRVETAAAILLTQALHAITYGAFHVASILYVDTLSSDEAKTFGQAVNNAVTYGLGLTVGFFVAGILYEKVGSHQLFALSALTALFGGVVMSVYYAMHEK